MILFFDTETTGKCDFSLPFNDKKQPRLVSLACLLKSDDLSVDTSSFNVIVRPSYGIIPEEASNIHGITTEIANDCGVDLSCVLRIFQTLWNRSSLIVAHNIKFDHYVMLNEMFIHNMTLDNKQFYCTMDSSTPICKLVGFYGKYKWPKLSEAYEIICSKELDNAHNALADVIACSEVYAELVKGALQEGNDIFISNSQ